MSKNDESDSGGDDEPEPIERKQIDQISNYNPKSTQGKRKKKYIPSYSDAKLGRLSIKSRSKDSTSRKSKIDSNFLKKSRTEKDRNKQRGNSLRTTGLNWKNRKSRSKQRNKSLR
mmetsp:Transcript_30398/g.26929  ORF Transcript_30398/g.26929 Transcript_30398/m.26929 type:complete len:115 (-) Transcript_30398:3-347(-)